MLSCTDICNSVSPGNGYLESLIKPNTKAIFDGIKCVNESGILDNNNIQHDFDIIICATGFDVSHRPAFPVLGCGGQNLRDVWSQGPTHYLSVAAPGFPNYWSQSTIFCMDLKGVSANQT